MTEWYLSLFASFEKNLNGQSKSAIYGIRRTAIARFAELGFPTTTDEDWRFTDVSLIAKKFFELPSAAVAQQMKIRELEPFILDNKKFHNVVFLNGRYSAQLSSVHASHEGVKIGGLERYISSEAATVEKHLARYAAYDTNGFLALNTAFLHDGAFIMIPDGIVHATPVQIVFVSTEHQNEFVSFPRNLIIIGKNAEASIIETYIGYTNNTYCTNTVSEVVLGEGAVLEHERIQRESVNAFHIATVQVHQERNSSYKSNAFTFGGRLVRNNLNAVLDGEGAEATLNGLYFGTGRQHIDNHTTIDHAQPHCPSHELYKGILGGKSKGVFNGKIFVRKDAQKTDAKQTNKNLLLSETASIDTKPQLEIFANDVKCTHGATIGQLEEESVFYLRSRGISEIDARDMLTYAFANEIVEKIKIGALREFLDALIHEHLRKMSTP